MHVVRHGLETLAHPHMRYCMIHHMHEWRLVDFLLNLSALIRICLIHFDEKRQETAHIAVYPVTHLWLRAT